MDKWNKSKAIGNIAENIVEMMINSMPDWKCIKFGVENHIEELRGAVRNQKINPATKRIKSMPDFVAYNTKEGKTFFIEVKYRGFIDKRNGKSEYKLDFLNQYNEYWKETKLIVVHPHKPYFSVIDLKDIKENMCRKIQVDLNRWEYHWNFKDIEKEIDKFFPELKEGVLDDAIKLIPNLKDE